MINLGISSLGFLIELGLLNKYDNLFDLLYYSTKTCLETAEEKKIKIVELVMDPPEILNKINKTKFIELVNSYSIKKQVHGPFVDVSLCSHNKIISEASIKAYIETMKICKSINSKMMTIHPGLINFLNPSMRKHNIEQLKHAIHQLLDFSSSMKIRICLENMPKQTGIMLDENNIEDIFSIINDAELFLTYDTSHFYTVDGNVEILWKKFHDKIKNIHLVDNFSKESDTHPQLGKGKINFKEIFYTIQKYNYKGPLIIELSSIKDLENSLNYINKIL